MSYSRTHCFICENELREVIPGSKMCCNNYGSDFHNYINTATGGSQYRLPKSTYWIFTFFDETRCSGIYDSIRNKSIFEVDGQIPPLSIEEVKILVENYNILK